MGNTRRKYTKDFKKESIDYLLRSGKKVSEVASELGLRSEILNRWRREYEQHEEKAFPGQGNPVEAELAKLRKELADVKMERDILKKAVSIFSKDQK
jgi:transposase